MSDPSVDHILPVRKAFFLLLTVCFSVMLAILLAEKHDVVKAREQLTVIKKTYTKSKKLGNWGHPLKGPKNAGPSESTPLHGRIEKVD